MIKRQTIVLYITSMHRGGAERVMSILANSFAESGHRVILATDIPVKNDKDDYVVSKKVECIHIKPVSRGLFLKNVQRIKQLRRIIKSENADTVLSFLGKQNYRMLLATIGLKCRKCVSVRNDPNREYGKSRFGRCVANKMFALADVCVFQIKDAKKYFTKKIQDRSVIIPNPVDEKFFDIKRTDNPKNIITVGRLVPQKNQKLLIDAFTMIADEIKNEKLLIYGTGPLKEELEGYVNKIKMSDRIVLMGEVKNIEKELAKARLFVLSSDYEGMPNALLEAIVVGVPCVSTDCPCGGPKQLLKARRDGVLVPCNDAGRMSEAILSSIKSSNVPSAKNDSGLNDAVENYRIDRIIHKWENVLKKTSG